MSMLASQPTTPHQQAAKALQAIQQQNATGLRAMVDACGREFSPPKDLIGASQIIKRLRADRDKAMKDAEAVGRSLINLQQGITADAKALASERFADMRADSILMPAAQTLKKARAELVNMSEAATRFKRDIRDAIVDTGLTEHPALGRVMASATPMQRAAEAGAVLIAMQDRVAQPAMVELMRANYLRSRGWKLAQNNAWLPPGEARVSVPVDAAVARAVRTDTAPFQVFAKGMIEKSMSDAIFDGMEFVAMAEDVATDDAPPSDTALPYVADAADPRAIEPSAPTESIVEASTRPIEFPAEPVAYHAADGSTATNIREDPPGSGRIVADFAGETRVIANPFAAHSEADPGPSMAAATLPGSPLPQRAHIPVASRPQVQPPTRPAPAQPRSTAEVFVMPTLR